MPKKRLIRKDWYDILTRFTAAKAKRKRIEMSNAKVAQVQAWRLRPEWPRIDITTQGNIIILAKG